MMSDECFDVSEWSDPGKDLCQMDRSQTTTPAIFQNTQCPSYPRLTRSVLWLLMPWLFAWPSHQQLLYSLCKLSLSLSLSHYHSVAVTLSFPLSLSPSLPLSLYLSLSLSLSLHIYKYKFLSISIALSHVHSHSHSHPQSHSHINNKHRHKHTQLLAFRTAASVDIHKRTAVRDGAII